MECEKDFKCLFGMVTFSKIEKKWKIRPEVTTNWWFRLSDTSDKQTISCIGTPRRLLRRIHVLYRLASTNPQNHRRVESVFIYNDQFGPEPPHAAFLAQVRSTLKSPAPRTLTTWLYILRWLCHTISWHIRFIAVHHSRNPFARSSRVAWGVSEPIGRDKQRRLNLWIDGESDSDKCWKFCGRLQGIEYNKPLVHHRYLKDDITN